MSTIFEKIRWNVVAMILVVASMSYAQNSAIPNSTTNGKSDFRYVIVDNEVQENERIVQVLMDEKSFSEENLRKLFRLVSKRLPSPSVLRINVATSLDQLATPEEADQGWNSGETSRITENHFWAIYLRSKDDEFFRYSPVNDRSDNRIVQIKKPN
ncbi:MAG: hypothetical protein ACRD6X_21710 [Pyrinomonadaceae bacterium]